MIKPTVFAEVVDSLGTVERVELTGRWFINDHGKLYLEAKQYGRSHFYFISEDKFHDIQGYYDEEQ